jgi:hypothetical protein
MPRLSAGSLAILTSALLCAAGAAYGDSRLFAARSDRAGVTIVGATLNGAQLPVAGQGGGVTFFRIDNPGGAVPCANRIDFAGSDGSVASMNADVCANGAEVTVSFAPPAAPPPARTPPPASTPAGGVQQPPSTGAAAVPAQITIATDDPAVTIESVFIGGKPVDIGQRAGNAVVVAVPPGTGCQRDLGLALNDGRRIARDADICANSGQVLVELTGGGTGGAAGATEAAPAPAQPPSTNGESVAAGLTWMFVPSSDTGSLAFATPNTDESEFTAVCSPGSGEVTIALGRSAPEVQPSQSVDIAFTAGTFAQTYKGTGSDVSQTSNLSNPLITLKTSDALWPALIRESALGVQIGSSAPYSLSLAGSGAKARQFLAFCNPAPEVGLAPPAGPGGGGIPFLCEDGSAIRVTFDDASQSALVMQAGAPPVVLRRVASSDGARYLAGGAELVGHAEDITWRRPGGFRSTCHPH